MELVQIVNGYAKTGAALVSSGVDKIIFTGSLENGKRVLAAGANTLTPVVLELGGKDPLIVCDDAHMEQAVHAALTGASSTAARTAWRASARWCSTRSTTASCRRSWRPPRALRQGEPMGGATVDLGAIVSPLQLELIEGLVQDAVRQGSSLAHRAASVRTRTVVSTSSRPFSADVTAEMRIAHEETFGPVMLLDAGQERGRRAARGQRHGLRPGRYGAFQRCRALSAHQLSALRG